MTELYLPARDEASASADYNPKTEIDLGEAAELGALDGGYFASFFFPKAARQAPPNWEGEFWQNLDNPRARYLSYMLYRGSAKTTRVRIGMARRISYGIGHTIMCVGLSQDHAARSVEWLLRAIETNRRWAQAFQLEKGSKWTGSEVEIRNKLLDVNFRILALGITGSVRGVNIDDYRPDFIIGDDICDEENTKTPEGRAKIEDLWFGALKESLAPASEAPEAKQVLLGTLLHPEDVNAKCLKDPEYLSMHKGILDEQGNSTWPDRWPTEVILRERNAAIQRNQLSLWTREKMCKYVSRERAAFDRSKLQTYEILPDEMVIVLRIDPVPPAREGQLPKGDYECLTVLGRWKNRIYVLEYSQNRGHQPDWTVSEFFRLLDKWRPLKVKVETVAYQRTLSWLLRQAMQKRRRFVQVDDVDDKRSKDTKIRQGLTGVIANQLLYLRADMSEAFEQLETYPDVPYDDLIETIACGADDLMNDLSLISAEHLGADSELAPLPDSWRSAP